MPAEVIEPRAVRVAREMEELRKRSSPSLEEASALVRLGERSADTEPPPKLTLIRGGRSDQPSRPAVCIR